MKRIAIASMAFVALALVALRPGPTALRGQEAPVAKKSDQTSTEMAESASPSPARAGRGWGRGFVDQDEDGVCDRLQRQSATAPPRGGRCRGFGRGAGRGLGFVDENGDGVCDRLKARDSARGLRGGRGWGRGAGRGFARGAGWGPGFVDQDEDGVCDRLGKQNATRPFAPGRGACCRRRNVPLDARPPADPEPAPSKE